MKPMVQKSRLQVSKWQLCKNNPPTACHTHNNHLILNTTFNTERTKKDGENKYNFDAC